MGLYEAETGGSVLKKTEDNEVENAGVIERRDGGVRRLAVGYLL